MYQLFLTLAPCKWSRNVYIYLYATLLMLWYIFLCEKDITALILWNSFCYFLPVILNLSLVAIVVLYYHWNNDGDLEYTSLTAKWYHMFLASNLLQNLQLYFIYFLLVYLNNLKVFCKSFYEYIIIHF